MVRRSIALEEYLSIRNGTRIVSDISSRVDAAASSGEVKATTLVANEVIITFSNYHMIEMYVMIKHCTRVP